MRPRPHTPTTRRHLLIPALALTLVAAAALAGCGGENRLLAPQADVAPGALAARAAGGARALRALASSSEIHGPTVITEPGAYRLAGDFTATGDGIVIQADDVQLSLGGYTITGPGNKAGRAIVLENVRNVSVSDGTVRTFGIGVALLGSSGSTVRGVRIEGGDETAAPPANPPQIGLLLVNSSRNMLAGNELTRVNLGIFVRGAGSFENNIRQNTVTAGSNGLLAICYNPAMGEGPAGPARDRVLHNVLDGFGTGIQTSSGSASNRFVANQIRFLGEAWQDLNGTNEFLGNKTEQL